MSAVVSATDTECDCPLPFAPSRAASCVCQSFIRRPSVSQRPHPLHTRLSSFVFVRCVHHYGEESGEGVRLCCECVVRATVWSCRECSLVRVHVDCCAIRGPSMATDVAAQIVAEAALPPASASSPSVSSATADSYAVAQIGALKKRLEELLALTPVVCPGTPVVVLLCAIAPLLMPSPPVCVLHRTTMRCCLHCASCRARAQSSPRTCWRRRRSGTW